jgi:phage baseplate assembly protein W
MGTYSFKATGKTQEQRTTEETTVTSLPIGIKTPLELGTTDGILLMHHTLVDQVHDNLRNLLLTNFGERVGLYNLGANLRPLTSEWSTLDDFDSQAMERISTAIQRWMSYISLENYISRLDTTETQGTIVKLVITYNVPALNVIGKSLEISLKVM